MSAGRGSREGALAEAFVGLADTLVADYDVIELLHRLATECVDLLRVDAAGLLLSDQRGALRVVASSSEEARLLELFEVQEDEGPCLDCFHTGQPVSVADLRKVDTWPRFAVRAQEAGFRSVHALPLRLRSEVVGALNLFGVEPGGLRSDELRVGQALADVATIGILQERAIRHRDVLAEQLEVALHSRVAIEQAKGVLAERHQLDMDVAFALLRNYARASSQRLSDLARGVVEGNAQVPAPH